MRRAHMAAITLSICAGLGARPLAAQTGFNGVITFTNYARNGTPSPFVQTTKGHKVRLDGMGGDSTSMIVDGDTKVMMLVTPRKKQYVTMTEADMKLTQEMMAPMMAKAKARGMSSHAEPGKFGFTNTGKTEIVAGVRCQIWHGFYDNGTKKEEGEACVATGVGFALAELTFANPMMRPGAAGSAQFEQYRELVSGNKGILKVTKIENGKRMPQLEATKIERSRVSDEAFKPPAGYTELRMHDMMLQAHGAMKQLQPGKPKAGEKDTTR